MMDNGMAVGAPLYSGLESTEGVGGSKYKKEAEPIFKTGM